MLPHGTDAVTLRRVAHAHDFATGLRAAAAIFDAHPEYVPGSGATFYRYATDAADLASLASRFGDAEKRFNDYEVTLTKTLVGGVRIQLCLGREAVCTKTVTGTRLVTRTRELVPAVIEEYTESEDVEEWTCPESLLRPDPAPAA